MRTLRIQPQVKTPICTVRQPEGKNPPYQGAFPYWPYFVALDLYSVMVTRFSIYFYGYLDFSIGY